MKRLNIYDKELFDTPKPELLIKRIIEIATNEGEIVLDAYLGSGTTTAVAHKMNRAYIGIEINKDSCLHIQKRMLSVIDGENGGISSDISWHGGGSCDFITI